VIMICVTIVNTPTHRRIDRQVILLAQLNATYNSSTATFNKLHIENCKNKRQLRRRPNCRDPDITVFILIKLTCRRLFLKWTDPALGCSLLPHLFVDDEARFPRPLELILCSTATDKIKRKEKRPLLDLHLKRARV